jgi:hypothetical protein
MFSAPDAGRAGRSICGQWTVTRSPRSARWCDDNADIKGSTKIPAEMTIPTSEPASRAEIYQEMANKRDRAK